MGWLSKAIATPRGYVSTKGELLKRKKLTPEEIATHNGTAVTKEETTTTIEVGNGPIVGGDPIVETKVEVEETTNITDLEKLTKKQLEAYAKDNDIPLQSKKSKKVILEQLLSQE